MITVFSPEEGTAGVWADYTPTALWALLCGPHGPLYEAIPLSQRRRMTFHCHCTAAEAQELADIITAQPWPASCSIGTAGGLYNGAPAASSTMSTVEIIIDGARTSGGTCASAHTHEDSAGIAKQFALQHWKVAQCDPNLARRMRLPPVEYRPAADSVADSSVSVDTAPAPMAGGHVLHFINDNMIKVPTLNITAVDEVLRRLLIQDLPQPARDMLAPSPWRWQPSQEPSPAIAEVLNWVDDRAVVRLGDEHFCCRDRW